jgi:hypothetical protein
MHRYTEIITKELIRRKTGAARGHHRRREVTAALRSLLAEVDAGALAAV